jgi:phage shock protein C
MKNNKQLKRSKNNRVLFGIIGGIAEYFETDAVLCRLVFIVSLVFTGFFPFGFIYLLAAIVISEELGEGEKRAATEVKVDDVKTEDKKNEE